MQQGAAPAQAELRSRAEALWILLNRSGMTSNKGVDLIMERLSPDAHTPEYVSGWLAGREALVRFAIGSLKYVLGAPHLESLKRDWLALAPPTAPPVQQIEDELPPICMEPTPFAVKDDPVDGSFSGVAPCGQPLVCPKHEGVNEDRMLLLKALLGGDAQRTGPDELIVYTGGRSPPPRFRPTLDSEGFPILTDELRSALTKATHG